MIDPKAYLSQNDKLAQHLEIELLEMNDGRASARMPIKEFHLNSAGVVHGGAIFSLADYAFAAASNSRGQLALSISASIYFLKAISEGTLTATAEEVSCGSKLGTYNISVKDETGELIATFQGMVYRKKEAYGANIAKYKK